MYEFTELFIYKFIFIAEILIAMHLYYFRRKKRSYFVLRVIAGVVFCMAVGYAYPIAAYSVVYSSVMFFVLFFICSVSFGFIYDVTVKQIFFLSFSAYTTQHFAHELYTLLANAFRLVDSPTMGMYGDAQISAAFENNLIWVNILVYVEVYFAAYWFLYKAFGKKVNKEEMQLKNFPIAVIAALVLAVDVILSAVTVYISEGYSRVYTYISSIYNLICCMLILYIEVNLCIQQDLRKELETVSVLFHETEKRFRQSDENVMLLNLKCHDLKHQLKEYADKKSINEEYVKEMVDIIDIYDSTVKTGNNVLDLILTEKSLFCKKHNIILTCLADCSQIGFISDSDLYSLFGNIIDNATEAVMKITDDSKRSINFFVRNIGGCISIEVENYFTGEINIGKDGLPRTVKEDKNYHGYGLKSVQMITEKYGGDFKISVTDDIFSMSILFWSQT